MKCILALQAIEERQKQKDKVLLLETLSLRDMKDKDFLIK